MAGIAAAGTAQTGFPQIPVNPAQPFLQKRAYPFFHSDPSSQKVNSSPKIKAASFKRPVFLHCLRIHADIPAPAAGFRAGGSSALKLPVILRNCDCFSCLTFLRFLPFFLMLHGFLPSCPALSFRLSHAAQTVSPFRPSALHPGSRLLPFLMFQIKGGLPAKA